MDTVGELMVRRDSVLERMRFDTLDETWQRVSEQVESAICVDCTATR